MAKVKVRRSSSESRARITILSIILILVVASIVSVELSKRWLYPDYYTYKSSKLTSQARIVQLSDLYGKSFGKQNKKLIDSIGILKPDIIAVTGDMLPVYATETDVDALCDLLGQLKELIPNAPIFYALGDTENDYIAEYGNGLLKKLKDAGANVLECKYEDITIPNEIKPLELRIGGVYGDLNPGDVSYGKAQTFMNDFCFTDKVKILLTHDGKGLLNYGYISNWNVDLTLSGHTLGGIVRVPVFGGFFGIDGAYFSKYSKGKFDHDENGYKSSIVSAGLGTDREFPMRFNNLPDLVCVDMERDLTD